MDRGSTPHCGPSSSNGIFRGNLNQREIAGRLGLSQMHVSRLIRKACEELRSLLTGERAAPGRSHATMRHDPASRSTVT
ncbi:sigma factor-like helix-turn-helix DNA-binding protein [Actinoallomurus rhizosphaericola]|uniref:sigma factor-like helix-turn-helix DNA-binding protein n=1 Tax=Actinoallomurus rhizosphaericola TaxID=2952536 RepID=UPI002092E9BA|nr:sigma factor-like helix-turn-helix DNA-binding protein [Actinoallomurus rhizosphaericola]MCO5997048.1 hypothetical protein [Actinoallomurus rhizosphaericola]